MPNTILWQNSQLRIVSPEKAPSDKPYIIQEVGDNDLVTGEPMWFGVAPERQTEHLYSIIRGMAEELVSLRASVRPNSIVLRDHEYKLYFDGMIGDDEGNVLVNLMQQCLLAIRTQSDTDTLAHSTAQQIHDKLGKYGDGVVVFTVLDPLRDPKTVLLRTVYWGRGILYDVAGYPSKDEWASIWQGWREANGRP